MSYPTLHIYSNSLNRRRMSVLASDKQTKLYDVRSYPHSSFSSRWPDMFISSASTGRPIAVVTFHRFSSTELEIRGRPLRLTYPGWPQGVHHFDSASAGQLTWKPKPITTRVELLNERKEVLARLCICVFLNFHKQARLELRSPLMTGVLLEETIVTGLAMIERWSQIYECS